MDNPRRILLIQLKRAGDVLLTTPIAPVLKRCWPLAQVDFLVDTAFASLLENNPYVDTVRVYDRSRIRDCWKQIRAQKYDMIFDFQSSPRSALTVLGSQAAMTAGYRVPFWGQIYQHTVPRPGDDQTVVEGKLSLLKPWVGAINEIPSSLIQLTSAERRWAEEFRAGSPQSTVIGVVPTHRRASRRWKQASFAELVQRVLQAGYSCWLFWGPGERDLVEDIQRVNPGARLIPATTLRQMAALFSLCGAVVTNDNGPMHLAVAVGIPTVTIYGPTNPHAWNPGGNLHRILQAPDLTCLGCNLNECPFNHECMERVSAERAFQACQEVLAGTRKLCNVK